MVALNTIHEQNPPNFLLPVVAVWKPEHSWVQFQNTNRDPGGIWSMTVEKGNKPLLVCTHLEMHQVYAQEAQEETLGTQRQ